MQQPSDQFTPLSLGHCTPAGDLTFSGGGWNVEFFVIEPWPERALIMNYDASVENRDGKPVIAMNMANGSAVYDVMRFDDKSCAYLCTLRPGATYTPPQQH